MTGVGSKNFKNTAIIFSKGVPAPSGWLALTVAIPTSEARKR